jgi:hypothetical protein
MGREIESRQGIGWKLFKKRVKKDNLKNKFHWKLMLSATPVTAYISRYEAFNALLLRVHTCKIYVRSNF